VKFSWKAFLGEVNCFFFTILSNKGRAGLPVSLNGQQEFGTALRNPGSFSLLFFVSLVQNGFEI
jgi:hypothetical protein